jgi:hypothetical protein
MSLVETVNINSRQAQCPWSQAEFVRYQPLRCGFSDDCARAPLPDNPPQWGTARSDSAVNAGRKSRCLGTPAVTFGTCRARCERGRFILMTTIAHTTPKARADLTPDCADAVSIAPTVHPASMVLLPIVAVVALVVAIVVITFVILRLRRS